MMRALLKLPPTPLDYNLLMGLLSGYRYPRNKVHQLLGSGELVRVKKGIYVRGQDAPHSLPLLANMVYGPSYVSLDYALAHHGLIPERVHTVTSVTIGRRKLFRTPVGRFEYEPLPAALFAVGFQREQASDSCVFLVASPEKALVDRIWRTPGVHGRGALEEYLLHDLRLERESLSRFSLTRLRAIAAVFRRPIVDLLVELVSIWRRR